MTAMTPLQQALAAWGRNSQQDDRQGRADDAVELAETGMFSVRQILLITGLPTTFGYALLSDYRKGGREGGRFNPESLDDIYQLWLQVASANVVDGKLAKRIKDAGTGTTMLGRLCGVSRQRIEDHIRRAH